MVWLIIYLVVALVTFIAVMCLFQFGESFTGDHVPLWRQLMVAFLYGLACPITIPVMLYFALHR